MVLCGPAGVGKRQLAVEYLWAHRADFDVVWTLRADGLSEPDVAAILAQDLGALARALHLPESLGPNLSMLTHAVREWLQENQRWLILVENVDSTSTIASVRELVPFDAPGGRVIITSRLADWPPGFRAFNVPPLDQRAAEQLLLGAADSADAATASALAAELGYLPLALMHAIGYLRASGESLLAYRGQLSAVIELLQLSSQRLPDDLVAATLRISLRRIQLENPGAAAFLGVFAYLAPGVAPCSWFTSGWARADPEPVFDIESAGGPNVQERQAVRRGGEASAAFAAELAPLIALRNPNCFDDSLRVLAKYNLVQELPQAISVHRLTQQAMRAEHSPAAGLENATVAAELLMRCCPPLAIEYWPDYAELLPSLLATSQLSAQAVSRWEQANGGQLLAVMGLSIAAGHFERECGQFSAARATHARALSFAEELLNPDDPDLATVMVSLGRTLMDSGDYSAARDLLEPALTIHESAYGERHQAVVIDASMLAMVFIQLGDDVAARPMLERALALAESVYGPVHPQVLAPLSNLGMLLADRGDNEVARPLLERALALAEAEYGPEHPQTLAPLSNLGVVLADLGEAEAARTMLEHAAALAESLFGPDDGRLAVLWYRLGVVHLQSGSAELALEPLGRSLAIDEAVHGPTHPDIAADLMALASACRELGQTERAQEFKRRVDAVLGP